jgi:hypothetical protein
MSALDWIALGADLRGAALDAHDKLPAVDVAYSFLLENPECFDRGAWPEDMPGDAPLELVTAYYTEAASD